MRRFARSSACAPGPVLAPHAPPCHGDRSATAWSRSRDRARCTSAPHRSGRRGRRDWSTHARRRGQTRSCSVKPSISAPQWRPRRSKGPHLAKPHRTGRDRRQRHRHGSYRDVGGRENPDGRHLNPLCGDRPAAAGVPSERGRLRDSAPGRYGQGNGQRARDRMPDLGPRPDGVLRDAGQADDVTICRVKPRNPFLNGLIRIEQHRRHGP